MTSSFTQYIYSAERIILNDQLKLLVFLLTLATIIVLLCYALWKSIRSGEKLKYEFITIIAHKFRTPLTRVKWTLDELISSEQDHYKKQELKNLQESNENLIKLTATLVDLTNSKHGSAGTASYHFEKINLCSIVQKKGEDLKEAFHEKNLFFSVQCAEPEIFVRADSDRLEFVLQTILENACTYSPPGRNVEVLVYHKYHKAYVAVTDYGIGISHLQLKHIFSKFFRAKNARTVDTEGFGVGLFLAQSVMHRHHGTITAYSDGVDKGSTFTIILPRVRR